MSDSNAAPSPLLLHGAFEVVRRHYYPLTDANVEHALAALAATFPNASPSLLAASLDAAAQLERDAYGVGVDVHDRRLTFDEAAAALAARHPGFAPETYRSAVAHGLYVSR